MCRRWMHERHQGAFGAGPRFLIDQSHALFFQPRERAVNVVHRQRDVMKARPTLRNVLGNGRVRVGRFKQLERRAAHRNEVCAYPLRCNVFRLFDLETKRVTIERERRVKVLHGNADMIELCFHGSSEGLPTT